MSDHFSGARALAAPIADITDVYAFMSPERDDRLVLVLNVLPLAQSTDLYSDSITYRFRLRPVTITSLGPGGSFDAGSEEFVFDCHFDAPSTTNGGKAPTQHGTLTGSNRQSVSFQVNDDAGGEAEGLRVFAGARLDSFFVDGYAIAMTMARRKLSFSNPGKNGLEGSNVLSIVIETDTAALFGAGASPLLAVVGETLTTESPAFRIERVGRPEIKNVVLSGTNFDKVNQSLEIRDLYNMEDAFALQPLYVKTYGARLNANLAFYDGLDEQMDWPPTEEGQHPLTKLFLADFLVVDTSKPFVDGSFLEIEKSLIAGKDHTTSGGRPLNDDIIDTLYGWIVTSSTDPHEPHEITQGIEHATIPASNTFPFLAEANPNPPKVPAPQLPVPGMEYPG